MKNINNEYIDTSKSPRLRSIAYPGSGQPGANHWQVGTPCIRGVRVAAYRYRCRSVRFHACSHRNGPWHGPDN